MAKRIEELPVFTKAVEFCDAVDAILDHPGFGRNRKLREQISDANDSITANMREGFEQSTDAGFARYLYVAKGSLGEVLVRLARANRKHCITADELQLRTALGEELGTNAGRVHQIPLPQRLQGSRPPQIRSQGLRIRGLGIRD